MSDNLDHPALLPRPKPLWAVQVPRFADALAEGARRNAIADAVEIVREALAHVVPVDLLAEAEADERRPAPWPMRGDVFARITPDEALAGCEAYPGSIRVVDIGDDGDLLVEGWWEPHVLSAVVRAHVERLGLGWSGDDVEGLIADAKRITCLFSIHHHDCALVGWHPDDWDVQSAHDDEVALEPPTDECRCDEYGWWVDYGPAERENAHRMTLLRS